eukprot:Ihof_evm1s144 gene=Ihof_evmTU1s144
MLLAAATLIGVAHMGIAVADSPIDDPNFINSEFNRSKGVLLFLNEVSNYAVHGHRAIMSTSSTSNRILLDGNLAIDGDPTTFSKSARNVIQPWWSVDLDADYIVSRVKIVKTPDCHGNVVVTVDDRICGKLLLNHTEQEVEIPCHEELNGRFLKIQLLAAPVRGHLSLNEVYVFGHL